MITILFIVIGSDVLKCVGMRWCEQIPPNELIRLWELGLVEIMSEATLSGILVKIYRRLRDKLPSLDSIGSRTDTIIDENELGK